MKKGKSEKFHSYPFHFFTFPLLLLYSRFDNKQRPVVVEKLTLGEIGDAFSDVVDNLFCRKIDAVEDALWRDRSVPYSSPFGFAASVMPSVYITITCHGSQTG